MSENKYDYGYVIHPDTTTEWAFNTVKPNSEVLELGCSNGNLTMHLQKKGCTVDIIELNKDAGLQASKFARNALLGETEGDLEGDLWYEKLKSCRYDYITILDVLEHLRQPEVVLKKLRGLLKPNGSLILSVPNMGHNSVMIDMLRNRLKYNKLGILDNTHLRFFTKDTLERMVRECGFCAVRKHVIQIPVGSNEIKNAYEDMDPQWEVLLKDRPWAEVFQFIYELKVKGKEAELQAEPLDTTKWLVKVYYKKDDQASFDEKHAYFQYIRHDSGKAEFHFHKENPGVIRIMPLYRKCILENITITAWSENRRQEILDYETNGYKIKNGCYCFDAADPEILIHLPDGFEITELHFGFRDVLMNEPDLPVVHGYLMERDGYIHFLEEQTRDSRQLAVSMQAQNQMMQEAQKQQTECMNTLSEETASLRADLSARDLQMNSLREDISQRDQTIASLSGENRCLHENMTAFQQKADAVTNENRSLSEKAAAQQQEIADLHESMIVCQQKADAVMNENRSLSEKSAVQQHEIANLQEDNTAHRQKIDDLSNSNQDLKEQVSACREEITEFEKLQQELNQKVAERNEAIFQLNLEKSDLQKQLENMRKSKWWKFRSFFTGTGN